MTFINTIKPEGQNFEELVSKAKQAIDILGAENIWAVHLHTEKSKVINFKEEKKCPCILRFALKPMNEATLIHIEVHVYGVTSASDTPSTKALVEILRYAGFNMAYEARHKIFCDENIKR